jgi:hypothetical protein
MKGAFFLFGVLPSCANFRLPQATPAALAGGRAKSELVCGHIMPLRCCTLLLYEAFECWAQDFELFL